MQSNETENDSTVSQRGSRGKTAWIALLIPCSLWIGLLSGMTAGSRFVPAAAGLEAGPMVLTYGVVGAIAALLIAVLLSRQLTARRLRTTALCALLLSAIGAGMLALRVSQMSRRSDARITQRYATHVSDTSLPPAG